MQDSVVMELTGLGGGGQVVLLLPQCPGVPPDTLGNIQVSYVTSPKATVETRQTLEAKGQHVSHKYGWWFIFPSLCLLENSPQELALRQIGKFHSVHKPAF